MEKERSSKEAKGDVFFVFVLLRRYCLHIITRVGREEGDRGIQENGRNFLKDGGVCPSTGGVEHNTVPKQRWTKKKSEIFFSPPKL